MMMQLSGNNQIPIRYITKPASGKRANPTITHLVFILNPTRQGFYINRVYDSKTSLISDILIPVQSVENPSLSS